MDVDTIRIWIKILCVAAAAEVFGFLLAVAAVGHPKRLVLYAYEEFSRYVRVRKGVLMDYSRLQRLLKKSGASFHFGKWVDPIRYTAVRLVLGVAGLAIGAYYGALGGVLLAAALCYLPGRLLSYLNARDNERLLPELKLVYHALALQIRAGVFVTDALSECYGSVQEERLRLALLNLSGDLVMKAELGEALDRFQEQFDNRYIDSLCITILQAQESGQAVDLLTDIAEQIKDMETALMSRKKSRLDRRITFYQLGIFAVVLSVILYACVTHMFSEVILF